MDGVGCTPQTLFPVLRHRDHDTSSFPKELSVEVKLRMIVGLYYTVRYIRVSNVCRCPSDQVCADYAYIYAS